MKNTDVFFAMPCIEGQMTSGEFGKEVIASKDYMANEAVFESRTFNDINMARNVIHDAKGMLSEAGIALGTDMEVELSHHYGIKKFRSVGVVIIMSLIHN